MMFSVMPTRIEDSPPAKRHVPDDVYLLALLRRAQLVQLVVRPEVAKTPIGMFTQKIDCQPMSGRVCRRGRARVTAPATIEAWLIPRAFPRSFIGKASVRMAALLEKRNADPVAWTILKRTSSSPDCERLQSADPIVKMAKPSVYSLHPTEHVREPPEVDEDRGRDELVAEERPDEVEERRVGESCGLS